MTKRKVSLDNNTVDAAVLAISAEGWLPEKAVLNKVSVSRKKSDDGTYSGEVEAVRYTCTSLENFDRFVVKVLERQPVISPEELDDSDIVHIVIPVSETFIKPYAIEFGKAKVSIVAPFVRLEKN